MKKLLLITVLLSLLSGCAGKKLMKDCTLIGKQEDSSTLYQCEDL